MAVIGPITLGNTFLSRVVGIGSISHNLLAIFPIIVSTSCSDNGTNLENFLLSLSYGLYTS